MVRAEKEITKDVYERAQAHAGYISDEDMPQVFDICERLGYGIYGAKAYEQDGRYICRYERGEMLD